MHGTTHSCTTSTSSHCDYRRTNTTTTTRSAVAVAAKGRYPTFLHMTRYHRGESRSLLTRFISLFGHAPQPDGKGEGDVTVL